MKVILDPHRDEASREAWALEHAPRGLTPRLHHTLFRRELLGSLEEGPVTSPARVLALEVGHVLVMSKIEGRPIARRIGAATFDRVGRCLARLHGTPLRRGPALYLPSDPTALFRTASAWSAAIERRRILVPSTHRDLRRALRILEGRLGQAPAHLFRRPVRRLCHGDLRWSNVLTVGRGAVLVDLEHAGLGDPAADLAIMTCRTPLTTDEEGDLLDAYHRAADDPDLLARYSVLRPFVALASALGAALDRDEELGGLALISSVARPRGPRAFDLAAELGAALERLDPPPSPATSNRRTRWHRSSSRT